MALDLESDLALVVPDPHAKFNLSKYPPVKLDGIEVRQGDSIGAIGSPLGLRNSLTVGVVGAINRTNEEARQPDFRVRYIQTDLHTNPGSSGGPLFNRRGDVVGMMTTRAEVEGISFAIQLDSVRRMINELEEGRRIFRPWVGFTGLTLSSELLLQVADTRRRDLLSALNGGVLVTKVHPNSPGSDAELLPGDIITHVNDTRVSCLGDVLGQSTPEHPEIEISVVRIVKRDGILHRKSFNSTVTTSEFDILMSGHQ